jgi:prepilin-type N-terminal cleavage/methylation domain-containing protein
MQSIRHAAFSLIEVVVAIGIFAVAVTAMLALLPALTRQAAEVDDALAAQRLPDGIRIELQRLARGNFDALATAIPVMTAPLDNGLLLVAARNGTRLHSVNHLPPPTNQQLSPEEQYFAVEVWRFDHAPLAYDPTGAVLPLYARVSGPYRVPGAATPTALSDRYQLTFTLVINR